MGEDKEHEIVSEDLHIDMDETVPGQKSIISDNSGIGVVEIVLILVVLIALVIIFKQQITQIVENAFASITGNVDTIIQ